MRDVAATVVEDINDMIQKKEAKGGFSTVGARSVFLSAHLGTKDHPAVSVVITIIFYNLEVIHLVRNVNHSTGLKMC